MRLHIAEAKRYTFKRSRRTSGAMRVRINLPNPSEGEADVSRYIRSGWWKYVICDSDDEARDFQWYAINHFRPILNKDGRSWGKEYVSRYEKLVRTLEGAEALNCDQLKGRQSGPGVYVFLHEYRPEG
jgi:citrate lyase beta subunit